MTYLCWISFVIALAAIGCDGEIVRRDPSDGASAFDASMPTDAIAFDGSMPTDAGAFDGSMPTDGSMPSDASAFDGSMPIDAALPCADPPGSACNPIVIDTLPFRHAGSTATASADDIDAYACAPTDESGPEVHYELRLSAARRMSFSLEEASGVDVDLHVLRSADPVSCVARANTTLDTPLGAGTWRVIVDTFHSTTDRSGSYVLNASAAAPAATALGTMWNTFYFLANEDEHTGAQDTPIYDASCREIARVRRAFHDSVCIEGSGMLEDDRVINYASTCTTSCPSAQTCGSRAYRICYSVLDPARYPWGMGAGSRALEPDRSMAVDPAFVALGSWVYFEDLDGMIPPGATEPHDGCLRADDVGGAITGNHFDFFSGTRARWLAWEAQLPTRTDQRAWLDDPRCYPTP